LFVKAEAQRAGGQWLVIEYDQPQAGGALIKQKTKNKKKVFNYQ
jgi:hypothetical protein